jgi:mannonate dehydratase
MHVGTQIAARDDSDFEVFAQLGVTHVCADPPGNPHGWTLEVLERHKAKVEGFGLSLDMVQLPLGSRPIEESQSSDILLAGADRGRQIDSICALIRNLARAGIPAAKYNMNLIGIPRTESEAGRGGSCNSTFRWAKADQDAPPGLAGVLDADTNWERIDYFLSRVVPVAEEHKVRLACHPHDPYTPPGYRGVTRVLGTVDGLKRFVSMHESAYHGLNFCQGTVGEMLEDPASKIFDVSRWFGERGKLFNVQFRNIQGRKLDFMEVFPDEGAMDMWRSLRVYKEVGYRYMLMPDHVPQIAGPNPQGVAFGSCYGYIRALLQALEADDGET